MNFAQFFQLMTENSNLFGPVYHGGFWNGKTPIRTTGRGALGTGAYFTTDLDLANQYAREGAGYNDAGGGKIVVQCFLDIKNPLTIQQDNNYDPCVVLLTMLGMSRNAADKMVEKAYEQHGYVGKQISTRAIAQGFDSIVQTNSQGHKQIVIWNAGLVKSISLV